MKKSDVKRLDPKVYMLHSVMKNHIGKNNAIHATKLANLLGINKRTLRLLRAEHNSSNSEFDNLILSDNSGYYLPEKRDSRDDTLEQIKAAVKRKQKMAIALLLEANELLKRANLDGQIIMDFASPKGVVEVGKNS